MENKTRKKVESMNSIIIKLEDIKNSQQSLIEKIGVIEVELFDVNSPDLDAELEKVMTKANDSFDIIKEALESFEIKRNKIENEGI